MRLHGVSLLNVGVRQALAVFVRPGHLIKNQGCAKRSLAAGVGYATSTAGKRNGLADRFTKERKSKMASEGYHEALDKLSEKTKDMHRAITSLMEELEAVDWYNQRAEACTDPDLKAILEHNRDEEKEHAAMVLEWIRRQDPKMDHELRDNLFKQGPITGDH
jgi:ferritin-like protein